MTRSFGLAADAAIGADRVDDLVEILDRAVLGAFVHQGFFIERAGRAGLNAFAAGYAGRMAHRVVQIEYRSSMRATHAHADHIVDLHFAAGANAQAAGNAGIKIDGNGGI